MIAALYECLSSTYAYSELRINGKEIRVQYLFLLGVVNYLLYVRFF